MNLTAFFTIIGVAILLYLLLLISDKASRINAFSVLKLIVFLFVSMFSVGIALHLADAKKQLKSKCPELERIENVYRIKE